MTNRHSPLEPCGTGIRLHLLIQPRASRNELAGLHGDRLRIRLTAPPVDGAANESLIRFLADRLNVARSTISITAGLSGRRKTLLLRDITEDEASRRLGI